jgi:hypothetical protein
MSEWPFRYLVVEWIDDVGAQLQRPLVVRRGEGVVDAEPARPPRARSRRRPARSVSRIIGLVGVSRWTSLVFGRIASRICVQVAGVHEGELDPEPRDHLVEER